MHPKLLHATQILELASGLLPRGMILSQHKEITFIESDLECLLALGIERDIAQKLLTMIPVFVLRLA